MNFVERTYPPIAQFFIKVFRKLRLKRLMHAVANTKHFVIRRYITKNYSDIIARYANAPEPTEPLKPDAPIWMVWWQGEEQMPAIIKACYNTVKAHAGSHPIHLLTRLNYKEFLAVEEEYIAAYESGRITVQYLADIFRHSLISRLGGIWIDATVYLNVDLDEIINGRPFVTGKAISRKDENVTNQRWTSYFSGTNSGHPFHLLMYDLLVAQTKKESRTIDYLMMDYFFDATYTYVPAVRNTIDKLPAGDYDFFLMGRMLKQTYDEKTFAALCSKMPLHKLGYRKERFFNTTDQNGHLTNYGYITKDV